MVSRTRAVLAALWVLSLPMAASATTCTWTGGDGDWQDPLHWTGCSGGNGDPANTPGPADTAIVNAAGATITLQQLAFVGQLDFSAGLITGSAPFDVATLNWSGGSFASTPGFATVLYIQNGTLTGTLASTDRFLRLVGVGTVTLSEGADLSVVNTIGVAEPCAAQPFAEICINPGSTLAVSSTGDSSQLDANLQNAGRLRIAAAPSGLHIATGQRYIQREGGELQLQGGELRQVGASDSLDFLAGVVRGSGRLQAGANIVFQSAQLDVGGAGIGNVVLDAGVALFSQGSRLVLDVQGQASYDTVTGTATALVQGVVQVRTPLATSTDSYNLMVMSAVAFNPVAQDIALFSHVLGAASTTLALTPAGGQMCTWSGSADSNFANPANWTGCGGSSPGISDSAVISSSGVVNIGSSTTVGRLKLDVPAGGLVVATDQALNINQRFDWVAGDITTSGSAGQLHLNFGGFGSIGDPAGLNDRNLDGTIANGFDLAFVENYGFTMTSNSLFENSANIAIINSNTGPAFNIDGGTFSNRLNVSVLEGAKYAGTAIFQQADPASRFLVRSALAWLNLQASASGELRTEGESALLVLTGAASTDASSQTQITGGKLVVTGTLSVAGQLVARRVEIDGSSATLTLSASATLSIVEMLVRGGARLDGNAPIALAFLELDGGTVDGAIAGTDSVNVSNALYIEGNAATSTINNRSVTVGTGASLVFYGDNTLNVTGSSNLLMQGELGVATQTAGQVATLTGTGIVIEGLVRVEAGRVLAFDGTFAPDLSAAGDQFIIDGTLQRIGQPLLLDGTTVRGNGTLAGTITLDNGIVNPGLLDIPPGVLTIDGDLTLGSGQIVEMELGGIVPGAQHDQIVVTGQLDLDNPTLDVSPNGPFDPQASDVFDLVEFGSLGASVFAANVAAGFTDTHGVGFDVPPPAATVLQLRPNGGGSASICTWDGSVGDWETPAHWSNCTGGSGNTPGTPGAIDTAIINTGTATLTQPVTVGDLQVTGGSIDGDFNLVVQTSLNWTGGMISAPAVAAEVRTQPGATAILAGGQKNLSRRQLILAGPSTWTTGLINLSNNAVVQIEPAGVLTSTPGGAPEAIQGTGSFVLLGQLIKTGTGTTKLEANVQLDGVGTLQVDGGGFGVLGSGVGLGWSVIAGIGTTVDFYRNNKSFDAGSSFSGSGLLRFGGTTENANTVVNGAFTPTGVVEVRWGKLDLTTAATSVALDTLRLSHPAALVDGSDDISISALLDWQAGTIDATSPFTALTILAGASVDLSVSATRIVSSRSFQNLGTMTLNGIFTVDSSEFVNFGTLTINNAGLAQILGSGSPRLFVNGGAMEKQGAGILEIGSTIASSQVSFGNDSPMTITLGEVQLYDGGTDTGAYNIGVTGQLHLRGSDLFDLEGGATGQGRLFARDSVTAGIRGTVTIERLQVADSAIVEIDSNLSSTTFSLLRLYGGELRGADDLSAGTLDWQGGTISGTTAQSFTVGTVPGSTLSSGTGVAVDGRLLAIGGSLNWTDGNIDLRGGARLEVVPGGQFLMNAPNTTVRSVGCSSGCSGVEIENHGTIRAAGTAGARYTFANAIDWTNAALLESTAGTLTINGELLTDPGSIIDIYAGGTVTGALGSDTILDVQNGVLRGNGTVDADVLLAAGTQLSPNQGGATPAIGTFTITGNLDHSTGGTLQMDVSGTAAGQFDQVVVLGSASPGPVEPTGTGITAGNSVAFVTHATRSGNYTALAGANAADYAFDNALSTQTRLEAVATGVLDCTWIAVVPGDWDTASNWDCSGAPGVPGSGDTARVLSASADIDSTPVAVNRDIGTLVLTDGRIGGTGIVFVEDELVWNGGTFAGVDAVNDRVFVGPAAIASMQAGAGAPRRLDARAFVNQGALTWLDDDLVLNDGPFFINASAAMMTVLAGNHLVSQTGLGGSLFFNAGTLLKQGVGTLDFGNVQYSGSGPLSIAQGSIRFGLHPDVDFPGGQIASGATLIIADPAPYTYPNTVAFTGTGTLVVDNSPATFLGSFASTQQLLVQNSGVATINSAGTVTVARIQVEATAALRGSANLQAGDLVWNGGEIAGTAGTSLSVNPGSASSVIGSATAKVLDSRTLNIQRLDWTGGSIDMRNGARLQVNPGGLFQLAAPDATPLAASCSAGCGSVFILNQGTLRAAGTPGAQYNIGNTLPLTNKGLLEVAGSTLTVDSELLTDPGSVLDINSGGTLTGLLGGDSNLDVIEGTLRGNGTVGVGVTLGAGTSLQPNLGGAASAIATFTINGNLDHSAGGVLGIDVAGTSAGQFDRVQVTGTVTPGPVEPFDLGIAPGGSVAFLQHSTRVGNYTTLTGTDATDFSFDNSVGSVTSLVRVAGTNPAIVVDRSDDPVSPGPGDACTAVANDCSLRGAILFANAQPGADTIEFAIPGVPSTVHVIALSSGALPTVSDALSIDGFTQGDATPNTVALNGLDTQLRVAIDGALTGGAPGLDVQTAIFALQGLAIYNVGAAVQVTYNAGGSDIRISGSYLGMQADGVTPGACVSGVTLATGAGVAHIGGSSPAERNLIGACFSAGVDVRGTDTGVEIFGNVIGVDRTLALPAVPGGNGINIEAFSSGAVIHRITIGEPGAGNIIGAMTNGIFPTDYFGSSGGSPSGQQAELRIQSNYIGRGPAGQDIGNRVGINFFDRNIPGDINALLKVGDGTDATLGNVLGFNVWSDVLLDFNFSTVQVGRNQFEGGSAAVSIPVNLGINYADSRNGFPQRNPNDDDDPDTGANLLMNHPDIISHSTGTSISVSYSIDTLPANANYGPTGLAVDFYEAADGKPARWLARDFYSSADHGGGSTPATKVFNFTDSLASTAKIVAIATDAIGSSSEASYSATQLVLDPVSDTPTGTPRTITGTVSLEGISAYPLPAAGGMVTVGDGVDGPVTGSIDGAGNFSIVLPTSGAVGSRVLDAVFMPADGIFGVSQGSTASIVVAGLTTTQTVISAIAPAPAAIGQTYTISTTVTALTGASAPDGTVQIVAGAPFSTDFCAATLTPASAVTSTGSCQITSTTPGVRQFTASYAGSSGFDVSTTAAPTAQVIRSTASFPVGAIVQTPAQTRVGEPFTIDILVRGVGAIPSGTITVTPQPFGSVQSCTLAPVPQTTTDASCALVQVAPAAIGKALQVRYNGSADLVFPAIGTVVFHDTLRALTTTTISAHTPEPSKIDQPVLVQFQVSAAAGAVSGAAPLNGTVRVSDGLDSCTGSLTAISSGTTASGSCSLPLRVAGARALVATYQTSENFEASTSSAVSHVVSGGASGTDLAVSVHNSQRVVNSGTELTYTIEVMNLGAQGAGSSRIENVAPAQLSGVSWTCIPTLPSQCPQSGSGSIDRLVDLVGGGRVTFRMTGLVGTVEGELVSTATVTAAQGVTDSNPANNSATDRDFIGVFGDGMENPDSE